MLINVLDYWSASDPIQAALNDAVDGDRVYIPGGALPAVWVAPAGGWQVKAGVEVFGDGPGWAGAIDGSTTLAPPASGLTDILVIDPSLALGTVFVHGIKITGWTESNAMARAVVASPSTGSIERFRAERVVALFASENAFVVGGAAGALHTSYLLSCYASIGAATCFDVHDVGCMRIERCTGANSKRSMQFTDSNVGLYVCGCERDNDADAVVPVSCLFSQCDTVTIDSVRIEDAYYVAEEAWTVRNNLMVVDCGATAIATGLIVYGDPPPVYIDAEGNYNFITRGLVVKKETYRSGPILIGTLSCTRVLPDMISIASDVEGVVIVPQVGITQSLPYGDPPRRLPAGVVALPDYNASSTNGGLLGFDWTWTITSNILQPIVEQQSGAILPVWDDDFNALYARAGTMFWRTTADTIGGPGLRLRRPGGWAWVPLVEG